MSLLLSLEARVPEKIALSVLDTAPVVEGSTEAAAINRTVEAALRAEELGYVRFWTAEHHSTPAIASSAPDLIALRIADLTSRLRVGAGGVMLPNHSVLQVAERYLTLEAFHPGRIDLGVGRAPGTDRAAAVALRRSEAMSYPEQLAELDTYLNGQAPSSAGHVRAVPRGTTRPPVYLLGSSLASAQLAAARGDAFAFAGHFSPDLAVPALRTYRERFTPGTLDRPHAILAVSAVAADTAEHAHWLAGTQRLAGVRFARGDISPLPSPQTAAAHQWSDHDRTIAHRLSAGQVIGDQSSVRHQLVALARATGADELMITTNLYDLADHLHSLELIAETFDTRTAPAPALASAR